MPQQLPGARGHLILTNWAKSTGRRTGQCRSGSADRASASLQKLMCAVQVTIDHRTPVTLRGGQAPPAKQAMNRTPQLLRNVHAKKETGHERRTTTYAHSPSKKRSRTRASKVHTEGPHFPRRKVRGAWKYHACLPRAQYNGPRRKGPGRYKHRRLCSRRMPRRPRASAQSNQSHITVRAQRHKTCFGRAGAKLFTVKRAQDKCQNMLPRAAHKA